MEFDVSCNLSPFGYDLHEMLNSFCFRIIRKKKKKKKNKKKKKKKKKECLSAERFTQHAKR